MKYGILSDIHSNIFALRAVLAELSRLSIEKFLILGDLFGYYPWAVETYEVIKSLQAEVIIGNHDAYVLDKKTPTNEPFYWHAAKHNYSSLREHDIGCITWLSSLQSTLTVTVGSFLVTLCHGTPDDQLHGQYFPDDEKEYDWLPGEKEVLMLGHTHYPLIRQCKSGGWVFNPGSVGQPRDGNPMPSYGIFDTSLEKLSLHRAHYDFAEPVQLLEEQNWSRRSILALQKNYKGRLKY